MKTKKNVLNQTFKESKKDIVVNINEKNIKDLYEKYGIDAEEEIKKDIKDLDEKYGIDAEEEIKKNIKEVPEEEPVNVEMALLSSNNEIISDIKEEEEVESPIYKDDGKEEGELLEEIKVLSISRTIESLTSKELRRFQRTGIFPK
jgi:hypothetical protein